VSGSDSSASVPQNHTVALLTVCLQSLRRDSNPTDRSASRVADITVRSLGTSTMVPPEEAVVSCFN